MELKITEAKASISEETAIWKADTFRRRWEMAEEEIQRLVTRRDALLTKSTELQRQLRYAQRSLHAVAAVPCPKWCCNPPMWFAVTVWIVWTLLVLVAINA